jgi:hypothetical protein
MELRFFGDVSVCDEPEPSIAFSTHISSSARNFSCNILEKIKIQEITCLICIPPQFVDVAVVVAGWFQLVRIL